MQRFCISGAGALFVMVAFGWLAQSSAWDKKPADAAVPSPNSSTVPPAAAVDNAEDKPGRFAIRATDKVTILVDTASGQTWMLMPYKQTMAWLPIERVSAIDRLRELGAKVSVKDGIVREVDLTNSTLTDADMEILGTLASLEQLILNGCTHLTDAGLVPVQRLTKLRGLGLERTQITDAGLVNLQGLTDLKYLSLNWTGAGDVGLKHLENLANLEVLYLCETKVGDPSLTSLSQMQKLQWLDLRRTRVTDAGLPHLGKLRQLRLLSLYGIPITDAGMPALTELSNLEVLTLARTPVTDTGLRPFAKLLKLKDLDLEGTKATPAGIAELQRSLPNCRFRFQPAPPQIIDVEE